MLTNNSKRSRIPHAVSILPLVQEGRENLKLMPGTRELLAWLSSRQVPCAVLTRNDQEAVDHFFEHVGLYVSCGVMNICARLCVYVSVV